MIKDQKYIPLIYHMKENTAVTYMQEAINFYHYFLEGDQQM